MNATTLFFKGVLVCLGKDTVVNVPFGKVTPYFMAKDKSAVICKKYFKKGKSVKVQIASRFKKTLQVHTIKLLFPLFFPRLVWLVIMSMEKQKD